MAITNINRVSISGNLTRDAELRTTASGSSVLSFSVAVNEQRKNSQTGEYEDYPNFFDCVMFGNRANALAQYLGKGTKVAIDGRLSWSSYEKDGERRSKVDIVVNNIEFMSSRNDGIQGAVVQEEPEVTAPLMYDEDIPF